MLCPFKDLTPLGHYTDRGPMDIGQYNGLIQYCGPHTASSMFLITSLIIVHYNYKGFYPFLLQSTAIKSHLSLSQVRLTIASWITPGQLLNVM